MVMDELFWQVWPFLAVWLGENRWQAVVKWHKKRFLQIYFQGWGEEIPPPLVSSSDEDSDSAPHHFGHEVFFSNLLDGSDDRADFGPATVEVASTARQDPSWESNVLQ